MRQLYFYLIFACTIWLPTATQAQQWVNRQGPVRLGLNVGGAWQTSDVKCAPGVGFGATLEIPIVENDHSLIGVNLRGRYLYSATYGRDWQRSYAVPNTDAVNGSLNNGIDYSQDGYYFANHRNHAHEFTGELMLVANRLRHNTGTLLYLFGGAGTNGYRVHIDQQDAFGNQYDFSGVSQDSKDEAQLDLWALRDGRYESVGTPWDRRDWRLALAGGVGLGKIIIPAFSLGIEYKGTWVNTDMFDGQAYQRDGQISKGKDIYHYLSFWMNFGFVGNGGGGGHVHSTNTPPSISAIFPTESHYITHDCRYLVRLRIRHIRDANSITFTHNGVGIPSSQFFYDPGTDEFKVWVDLVPGQNRFVAVARNPYGTARYSFTSECVSTRPPQPTVNIISPNVNVAADCKAELIADIRNVIRKDYITVRLNNIILNPNSWTYNGNTGRLQSWLSLRPGLNTISVSVTTPAGSASDQTTITCPDGEVPEQNIVICHFPPGNPDNPQTLTIPTSAWPAHQAHGDVAGACDMTRITICHNGTTISIPKSSWPAHQAHGDTQGPCPTRPQQITICHIPPGNPNNPQTLTISENAWPAHQAHGDTQGPCDMNIVTVCHNGRNMTIPRAALAAHLGHGDTEGPCPVVEPEQITICHIPPGNPNNPQTLTISPNAWPAHQAHGDTQGPCDMNIVTVCHNGRNMTIPRAALAAHLGHGDTEGPCPAVEPEKITICHIPPGNPNNPQTLEISPNAWPAHQAHGDTQGPCDMNIVTVCHNGRNMTIPRAALAAHLGHGDTEGPCPPQEPEKITICHLPPGNPNNPQTLEISPNAWPAHQAHGDTQGPCDMGNVTVCHNGRAMTIPRAALAAHLGHGDTEGPCPPQEPEKITICHLPPGNPDNPQTLEIPLSAWPAHQGHGDTQGACNMSNVTICHNGQTKTIPRAALAAHLGHGDTEGPCPPQEPEKITICHLPPGNPDNPQTLQISPNAWPAHQAHGDTQGACDMSNVTVCHNGQTKTIPRAALAAHLGHGDTQGPCAPAPEPKITICHFPPGNPDNPQTLQIPQSAWSAHQGHGDTQGACDMSNVTVCHNGQTKTIPRAALAAHLGHGDTQGPCAPAPEPKITICHFPPGNSDNPQTLQIPQSAWNAHRAHGDTQGACDMSKVTICHNNKTMEIPRAALAAHKAHGDKEGACPPPPEPKVKICHFPPGNPDNPQTLEIPQSAMKAHKAHGDTEGACDMTKVTICHNDKTIQVPRAALAAHKAHGDKEGACPPPPEPKVKICHFPPGNPDNPQTIEIPQSALKAHKAHGDTEGACDMKKITICHNGNTIQIPKAAWPTHQKHGDKQGECEENNGGGRGGSGNGRVGGGGGTSGRVGGGGTSDAGKPKSPRPGAGTGSSTGDKPKSPRPGGGG